MLKKKKNTANGNLNILTDETNFSVVEAYKAVRANINFAIPVQGCKKVMLCSSYSGEGKTTTCINIAITIAQTGASVLLIDGDLRKSSVHKYLNLNNNIGLSNYLSNMADIEHIINDTHIPNLKVITSGSTPPNPAELLASNKMGELFSVLEKRELSIIQMSETTSDVIKRTKDVIKYDYIIIDTPPICVVSDALPLSKLCDGVILVVSHMETTHTNVKESLEKLNFAGANVVGMILNKIKINHTYKSYKNYKYKYYKEYKDEEDSSKNNNE
ncbi:MAG: CpsD/CapB family tyrosine-protein kinase [Oscillospiraceae bacterium]|nr:CpsD/CapB family tyrosine-protein kinase [Oscillospiraceae bacterium]